MSKEFKQKECIWDIPEDKRHCEFCAANCINPHATSETTATIVRKTTDKIPTDFTMTEASAELEQAAEAYENSLESNTPYLVTDVFKAGAEWQKDIIKKEINDILNDCVARFGCRTSDYYEGATDACKYLLKKYAEIEK